MAQSEVQKIAGTVFESAVWDGAPAGLDTLQADTSASRSVWHTPVPWILDVLDDLAEHAVLPLQGLDLLLKLDDLH